MEIIYGLNPIKEALVSNSRAFTEILVSRKDYSAIVSLAKGVKINPISGRDLDKVAGTQNHQGIAARVSAYRYALFEDISGMNAVILLDSVEDPQNLGAIIRSAFCLCGAGVVIPYDRSASITPAVVKASAGATEHARVVRVKNLRDAARRLKKAGFWLIGLDASAGEPLTEAPAFDRVALCLGGEDSGVRRILRKEIDLMVRIPMKGSFNSLNVAQSAAIGLYELSKGVLD